MRSKLVISFTRNFGGDSFCNTMRLIFNFETLQKKQLIRTCLLFGIIELTIVAVVGVGVGEREQAGAGLGDVKTSAGDHAGGAQDVGAVVVPDLIGAQRHAFSGAFPHFE